MNARKMTIGLTYDLRDDYLALGFTEEETLEFDRLDTIEAIESTLDQLGYATDRIGNIWALAERLVKGDRFDLVFNIAEGLAGFGRESQVPALLEAYGLAYTFSDPLVLALTLHKGMAKRVVRDGGVKTPPFAVVENLDQIAGVDLPFPLFAKPLAEGTGKGVDARSKITGWDELTAVCRRLLKRFGQPVLVETFLPGREFTVGIVGEGESARVIGVMEVELLRGADPEVYSARNKEECDLLVKYHLADDAEADLAGGTALAAYRILGCRDAGRVDIRSDADGVPHFIEINPLPGIHPEHSDLPILSTLAGFSYPELIGQIVDSALRRAAAGSAAGTFLTRPAPRTAGRTGEARVS